MSYEFVIILLNILRNMSYQFICIFYFGDDKKWHHIQ